MQWTSAAATDSDFPRLLDDVVAQVARGLVGGKADLVFAFAGVAHRGGAERLVARLAGAFQAPVVGCTAGGVIGDGRELEGVPALAVLAGRLPGALAHPFALRAEDLPDPDAPPRAWHEALGVSPADQPSFVLFSDPFGCPTERLLAGLDYAWPGAVVVGGLASGARRPGEQALFAGARVVREGAVGVALMGNVVLTPAVAQGCRPLGPARVVSACRGHLLEALGGRPALEVLEATVGEASEEERPRAGQALLIGLEAHPYAPHDGGPWLVRPLMGVDEEGHGIVVGEPLRRGRRVRFHVRDRATSHEDLERTLAAVDVEHAGPVAAALLVSCLGRGAGLYGRPDHDVSLLRARLGDVPVGGFFAQGEIGPVGGVTHVHGFTSALGLWRPRPGR